MGGRIVGGEEATPHAWPYVAAVFFNDMSYLCHGVLVAKDWVLTTAFCAEESVPRVHTGFH